LLDATQWLNRKEIEGASLEITPAVLAPAMTANSAVIPKLLSITFERGTIAYPGAAASDDVTNVDAMATWKTAIGDTTALYTYERQGRDLASFGFAGEVDQFIDISQAIKFGAWRVSVGASLMALADASPDDDFIDNSISGTFALRYAPERGAKFEASFGRTHDAFSLDDDDYSQRSRATSLAISLDLSDCVQDALDRRDTHLTFQYRHQLHQSELSIDESLPMQSERNADALLLSFGTPMN
jgi:hypothetical protein